MTTESDLAVAEKVAEERSEQREDGGGPYGRVPEAPGTSGTAVEEGPDPAPDAAVRPAGGTVLGVCTGGEHPSLQGRARVRWREPDGAEREAWLATLRGLAPRRGDRVLLTTPGSHDEPVVLGVLDGLRGRDEGPPADGGPLLRLGAGEAVRVASQDGTPLLEVRAGDEGPRIRLLTGSAAVSMPGTFRISADDVELEARRGEVRIDAAGDVKVAGEIVRLN